MQQGESIAIVRDTDTPPTKSRNTRMISAAVACGAEFAKGGAYSDTVEQTASGPKRTVTWAMNGEKKLRFDPIKEGEEIDFGEFRRRFESREWCEANENHPIAYLRAMSEHLSRLTDHVKTMRPMLLVRRGTRFAIVPSGSDPKETAEREKILGMLEASN